MTANSARTEWEGNPATFTRLQDISEQKRLEAQLLQTRKMEAVGNLAGGIAHDFNNILQAISGYAQILAMNKSHSDPDFRKLSMILQAAQRGSELIKRLMTFSQKHESMLLPSNINSEVYQACGNLENVFPKSVRIKLDLEDPIDIIHADKVQLEQIMMTVCANAREAMPGGGELTISTRNVFLDDQSCNTLNGVPAGRYVLLAISDTGTGIDSDMLDHIFEPFYTAPNDINRTGLGLAMVYSIVKKHNGYILCHSKKDQGTTFQIFFPIIAEKRMHPPDAHPQSV